MHVMIAGGGPAACAAVLALRRRGVAVRLVDTADRPSPPLVLNEAAVELLVDLSGGAAWLDQAHQLRRRVVRWGDEPARTVLEPAISLPGAMLRQRLMEIARRQLGGTDRIEYDADARQMNESWSLYAAPGAAPSATTVERFGRRVMLFTEVPLARGADPTTCWMEGCRGAWVFLAPLAARRAVLQAALPQQPSGDPADALAAVVATTRDVARLIEGCDGDVQVHPTAPTLYRPLGGPRWLAIGHAAMSLDPVCGDGTAQALRSGLLAAAIVVASRHGRAPDDLIEHYHRRVMRTFAAHLDACARIYDRTIFVAGWEDEIAMARHGANALARQSLAPLTFRLDEGSLVPIEPGSLS
jgi:2-polyprenyl-6-methoxyphenol hydroxylase-like FAD-dependent oxidoreductase